MGGWGIDLMSIANQHPMKTAFPESVSERRQRAVRAFSLVEITLSLGLVSFALVAMLGLLPTGLSTLRESMGQTVEAQILQTISSRAVISSFTNISATNLYFDREGLPVGSQGSAYYTANLTLGAASFPGSENAVALANSLKNLRVDLVARPNPSAGGRTNSYSIQIANSGK
jgi:uncharacterized protein (TIGR02598 family)